MSTPSFYNRSTIITGVPSQALVGNLKATAALANATPVSETIDIPGAGRLRVRFKASVAGTFKIELLRADGVTVVGSPAASSGAVLANTEATIDLNDITGESKALLTYTPSSGPGTITFAEVYASSAQGNFALTGASSQQVQGVESDGSAQVGKVLPIGGLDITAAVVREFITASADALTANRLLATAGVGYNGATEDRLRTVQGAGDAAAVGLAAAGSYVFNETAWERVRGNTQVTLLSSAVRAVSTNAAAQTNFNASGAMLWLNITAITGTGVRVRFLAPDPVTGTNAQLNVDPTLITATGIYVFVLYPGLLAGAGGVNVTQNTNQKLPRGWFAQVAHSDGNNVTYSLGLGSLI